MEESMKKVWISIAILFGIMIGLFANNPPRLYT